MKPMNEITSLITENKAESELDESDQNLIYFYWLINDFFNVHKQHENCTKEQLRQYILSNEIVNYLDDLL